MQFVCVFFHVCRKFELLISQGSVATRLRCHMGFVANFMFSSSAKILKMVKISHRYWQFKGGNFFETQCRYAIVFLNLVFRLIFIFFLNLLKFGIHLPLTCVHCVLVSYCACIIFLFHRLNYNDTYAF